MVSSHFYYYSFMWIYTAINQFNSFQCTIARFSTEHFSIKQIFIAPCRWENPRNRPLNKQKKNPNQELVRKKTSLIMSKKVRTIPLNPFDLTHKIVRSRNNSTAENHKRAAIRLGVRSKLDGDHDQLLKQIHQRLSVRLESPNKRKATSQGNRFVFVLQHLKFCFFLYL